MDKILVEICCGSAEDAVEAWLAGAKRIELNCDLFHGGLTPSIGSLLTVKAETSLSVMAMVRPREGGFCYSDLEYRVMLYDARAMLEAGADGIVFGFLHSDGTLDTDRTAEFCRLAHSCGKQAVFHRAFDVVPEWKPAMDLLAAIGIDRILTSGQEKEAYLALDTLREMIAYAAGRIDILPGGGIKPNNIRRVISETGCSSVHLSLRKAVSDTSAVNAREIHFGGCIYPPEDRFMVSDRDCIHKLISEL